MCDGVVDRQRRRRALHLRVPRHSRTPRLYSPSSTCHRSPGRPLNVGRRAAVSPALPPHPVPQRRHQPDRLRGPAHRVRPLAAVSRRLHVDAQPAALHRSARRPGRLQRPHCRRPAFGDHPSDHRRRRPPTTAASSGQESQRYADAAGRRRRLRCLHSSGRRHVGRVRGRVRGRARPGGEGRSRVQ